MGSWNWTSGFHGKHFYLLIHFFGHKWLCFYFHPYSYFLKEAHLKTYWLFCYVWLCMWTSSLWNDVGLFLQMQIVVPMLPNNYHYWHFFCEAWSWGTSWWFVETQTTVFSSQPAGLGSFSPFIESWDLIQEVLEDQIPPPVLYILLLLISFG